jgi:hypothetical protein
MFLSVNRSPLHRNILWRAGLPPRAPADIVGDPSHGARSVAHHRHRQVRTDESLQGGGRQVRPAPALLLLDWVTIDPIVAAMRRMVRGLEFDICEMAFTTDELFVPSTRNL